MPSTPEPGHVPPTADSPPLLLNVSQASSMPSVRVGRRRLYGHGDVEAFVQALPTTGQHTGQGEL